MAVANPTPRLAPVMMTVLPSNLAALVYLLLKGYVKSIQPTTIDTQISVIMMKNMAQLFQ